MTPGRGKSGDAVERRPRVLARRVEQARRAVVALGVERVAQRGTHQRRVLAARVVAHQPDAPDLARERAEAAGDLDAVVLPQVRDDLAAVDALRNLDGRQRRQPVLPVDVALEPDLLELVPEELRRVAVAGPRRLEAFLGQNT